MLKLISGESSPSFRATGFPVPTEWLSWICWLSLVLLLLAAASCLGSPCWSSFGVIVGTGRGCFYTLSYKIASDFIKNTCPMQHDGRVSFALDFVWWNVSSFLWPSLILTSVHRILMHFQILLVNSNSGLRQIELSLHVQMRLQGVHGCKEYRMLLVC